MTSQAAEAAQAEGRRTAAESAHRASVLAAGHPLPLHVRDGKVEPVGESGRLLGAPDEPDWTVTSVELADGDELILYTDGVTEARGHEDRGA